MAAIKSSLPPELISHYRKSFIPSHFSPFAVQTPAAQARRSWFTETRPGAFLDDGKVRDHLEGKLWIGPIPKTFSRCLIVDLDVGQNLEQRAEQVQWAFPEADPLTFTTPRAGLHQYFMLEGPAWSDRIHRFAVDRLEQAGIEIKPGRVEVYPDGGRAIRAPLGKSCRLLDAQTLEPVNVNRAEDLWTLSEILAGQRYHTLEIPADYGATQAPTSAGNPRRTHRRTGGEFMEQVDKLIRFGLDGPGQRNSALLRLSWYHQQVEGLSREQTVTTLWSWMQTRHNGHSSDYTRNPEQVKKHIGRICKAFDPDLAGQRPQEGRVRPGKAAEGLEARIVAYTDSLPISSRERAFLGQLLKYASQREGTLTLDGSETEVEIPSRTLKTLDREYGRILPLLLTQGYITRTKTYGAQIGRCSTYRLAFLG